MQQPGAGHGRAGAAEASTDHEDIAAVCAQHGIEVHDLLESAFTLTPVPGRGSAPAEEFLVDGGPATVGIIASVSKPFCAACDRLRLTADGQIRNCLFARDETDVRATLRDPSITELERRERIARLFASSVLAKLPGHGINDPSFIQPDRPMSAIGG